MYLSASQMLLRLLTYILQLIIEVYPLLFFQWNSAMGSSPSTPRPSPVPSTSRLDTANGLDSARRTNRQGFHEVELTLPESARATPSVPSSTSRSNIPRQNEAPSRPQRPNEQPSPSSRQPSAPGSPDRAKVYSQIEAADRHMVVGRLQRERTMAVALEFDVPKYKVMSLEYGARS